MCAAFDHQHRQAVFEQIVDGLPKHPGGFHGDMGAARCRQPIAQREQIGRHRAKRVDLLGGLPLRSRREQTGDHRTLMHIETTAALVQQLHHALSFAPAPF